MVEKWQQALSQWSAWDKSVREARAGVEEQCSDIAQLAARARFSEFETKEDLSDTQFTFKLNTEAQTLWNIQDEMRNIASEFVSQEMGLTPSSVQHHVFVNYWMKSVLPEIQQQPQFKIPKELPVWIDSRVVKRGKESKIVDSVSWYRGVIKLGDVAEFIQTIGWPTNDQYVFRKAKGGRPTISRQHRLYPEAIVCTILKDKQRLNHKEIADQFGWEIQKDSYNNPSISNTVRNRVKLGRKILQQHEEKLK